MVISVSHFTDQVEIAGGGHAPILSGARGPALPPFAGPRTSNTDPVPALASDSYTSVLLGGYDDPFQCQDVSQFDVIHFHCDYVHFPLVRRYKVPTVTTMHGMMHPSDLWQFFEEYREVSLVSISNDQRIPIPRANWEQTVYHGLPRDLFTFSEDGGDYLAFLGRMSPEKGVDRAIGIARETG